MATITNLQIGLNTPKSPYLNQATHKDPEIEISNKNSNVRDYVTRDSTDKYSLACSILRVFKATFGYTEKSFRKIRVKSKWNTAFLAVPMENFREQQRNI